MRRKTQDQWVTDARAIHGSKYDYSQVKYTHALANVDIICPVDGHGLFSQLASNHIRGHGCRKCQAKANSNRRLKTTDEWIRKARAVHGYTYDYSKVVYVGRHTDVEIGCRLHGIFEQTPGNHLQGNKCPECAEIMRSASRALTQDEWLRRAYTIHGSRYDYSQAKYTRSQNKVTIVCRLHGAFHQQPNNHLMGQNCPKCQKEAQDRAKLDTTEIFVRKAILTHGDRYDYTCVKYKRSIEKVEIGCSLADHGYFWQLPAVHLQGYGCPKCGVETVSALKFSNTDEWIRKATEVHGDRYDYRKVKYKSAKDKVEIGCSRHGFFLQIADNHLQKRGCPECAQSIGETTVKQHLERRGFEFASQVIFDDCLDVSYLRFDFVVYVDGRPYAIEFHGKQHYEPVRFSSSMSQAKAEYNLIECKKRDRIKADWCRENKVPLLEIPYMKIDRMPLLIDDFLPQEFAIVDLVENSV